MKLHLSLLKKFVDLPSDEVDAVTGLLNDLGLEVKGFEELEQDVLFTLELLANRPDHHGVLGMAREIASRNISKVRTPSSSSLDVQRAISLPLRVETEYCPLYIGLEMELPETMQLRSEVQAVSVSTGKHPLVETINYVQYELGHPMHAFDRDLLNGELAVRELDKDTEILALDDNKYTVPAGSLVICDAKKIVAVAGVIGCKNSCVTDSTTRTIIESALFEPIFVRKAARAMGLSTDASKVFERGADPEMPLTALKRLHYLLAGAGGATSSGGCRVVGMSRQGAAAYEPKSISVKLTDIQEAVNSPRLPELEISKRLAILGFQVEFVKKSKTFTIKVPSWRKWDVEDPEDIVEEFVRSYGLSQIKKKAFPVTVEAREDEPVSLLLKRLSPILQSNGFSEVVTKAFYGEGWVDVLSSFGFEAKGHLRILNAIEKSNSALRTSLLPHHVEVLVKNQALGEESCKIYETSRVFERTENGESRESYKLAFCSKGPWNERSKPERMNTEEQALRFKAVAEALLAELGIFPDVRSGKTAWLHPGIQVEFLRKRKVVGRLGQVHPELLKQLRCKGAVYFCEFDVDLLLSLSERHSFEEPSRFPAVKRDVTVLVPLKTSAQSVADKMESLKLSFCQDVLIHDWFRKEKEDAQRVTFRLVFRDSSRTLEAGEVDALMEQVREFISDSLKLELG